MSGEVETFPRGSFLSLYGPCFITCLTFVIFNLGAFLSQAVYFDQLVLLFSREGESGPGSNRKGGIKW